MDKTDSNKGIGHHILRILQSNKILKWRLNCAPVDCSSARKRRALEKCFRIHVYDCLFTRHSPNAEVSVRQETGPIDEGKKRL